MCRALSGIELQRAYRSLESAAENSVQRKKVSCFTFRVTESIAESGPKDDDLDILPYPKPYLDPGCPSFLGFCPTNF